MADPQKDKTSASIQSPHGDDALREDWKRLSDSDKDALFKSLPAKDQVDFATRVGMFENKEPVSVSASPSIGSIPWMKEKAYALATGLANELPTIGGGLGGMFGAGVGEGINPAGGGLIGGPSGAAVGGSIGEAARQGIYHLEGLDKYDDSIPKTMRGRLYDIGKEGVFQGGAELPGAVLATKILKPTLEKTINRLYYASGAKYGNPLGGGDIETVVKDLIDTEKNSGKAVTVGDLIDVIKRSKNEIGQRVDLQMAAPFKQNGKVIPLGKAEADSTPIVNAINSLATADPSIVKEAALNKAGKEAAYLENIRKEALKFQQHPWTYEELTSKRIRLNNELAPLYTLPPGEQRVYLLEHPDLVIKKAQADAIRDIIYPQMDMASGRPLGTTAELQGKRGALMSLENQVTENLGKLKTEVRKAKGAPPSEKINASGYITSSGKPGGAIHRATGLFHTPNVEARSDKQVARAFGNTVGEKVKKGVASPLGSEILLKTPLRLWFNPSQPQKTDNKESAPDEKSSLARPKELIERAKQLNPAAQGQVAYDHVAVNPETGHRVVSRDGITWIDPQNGQQVA